MQGLEEELLRKSLLFICLISTVMIGLNLSLTKFNLNPVIGLPIFLLLSLILFYGLLKVRELVINKWFNKND